MSHRRLPEFSAKKGSNEHNEKRYLVEDPGFAAGGASPNGRRANLLH